jgi:hypothetical protein
MRSPTRQTLLRLNPSQCFPEALFRLGKGARPPESGTSRSVEGASGPVRSTGELSDLGMWALSRIENASRHSIDCILVLSADGR